MRFVEHRIGPQSGPMQRQAVSALGDRRVLRLIRKWLTVGVVEDEVRHSAEKGTPQGAVISPLLANIYLHYVYDLWVQQWRRRHARGAVVVVRYADDTVVGFEHQADAGRFLAELRVRLAEFALDLHPGKTRLIEFGRHAAHDRAARGEGKPETFDFLGFTHICTRTKRGGFSLSRHTRRDRKRAKLLEITEDLRRRWHQDVAEQGSWLGSVMRGYFAYLRRANQHACPGCVPPPRHRPLAPRPAPAQPEGSHDLDRHGQAGKPLPAKAQDHSPLAVSALPRQIPKVGAVCGNSARTALCGGRPVMGVPCTLRRARRVTMSR
jgi:RNA-directed DNA polymerase